MSDDEALDYFDPAPMNLLNDDLIEQILRAKSGDPSKFASHWEMDEEDVDEATEEDILNNPAVRMLWAAENGKINIVEELTQADVALVKVTDKDGYTPLHRAAYNDHIDVAQYLLEHGADLDAITADGWTPLHSATNWGNATMASYLLTCGANINAQTSGKQTPLHLAASNSNSKETLELLLLTPGVDYTLKNALGETARVLAERHCPYHYLFEVTDESLNELCVK